MTPAIRRVQEEEQARTAKMEAGLVARSSACNLVETNARGLTVLRNLLAQVSVLGTGSDPVGETDVFVLAGACQWVVDRLDEQNEETLGLMIDADWVRL